MKYFIWKGKIGRLLLLPFLLSLSTVSFAAEISVTASVDRNQITIEDVVVLTITVSGSRKSPEPELPDLPDFEVSSSGTSSRVQIINGSYSSQVDYNYTLQPEKTGVFTIGPASVHYKGKTYQTEPITIRVEKASRAETGQGQLYITTAVDNPSPYVGEQILYTFRFYRKVQVANATLQAMNFDGFQVEDLGKEKTYTTVQNGIRYQVTELRKALYPVHAGTMTIPAVSLKCDVPYGNPQNFDFFNFGPQRTRTKILRSEPILLHVRDLPEEGKPANFSGLVGHFHLTADLGKKYIQEGESTTLTMTVSGEGDLTGAPRPTIEGVEQFKTYDDQPTLSRDIQGDKAVSRKIFKTALVPEKAGALTIPEVSLSFFDPKTERYETTSAGPFALKVRPAAPGQEQVQIVEKNTPQVSKEQVKMIGRDILPIVTDLRAFRNESLSLVSPLPLLLLLLPPFLFLGTFFYKRERDKLVTDTGYARRKSALKNFQREIREAKALLKKSDDRTLYAHLARTLQTYLGAKINRTGEAQTSSELQEALIPVLKDKALLEETHTLLQDMEIRRFAPGRSGDNESRSLIDKLEKLITRLEKAL